MITTNLAIKIEEATQPPTNNYEAYRLALFLAECVAKKYVSPDKNKVEKNYKILSNLKNTLSDEEIIRACDEVVILLDELKKEAM
tara:strand:- start:1307 stop:1561 length:255 start_codon:yes stop_codon:yes gene_type:complete